MPRSKSFMSMIPGRSAVRLIEPDRLTMRRPKRAQQVESERADGIFP